MDETSIPGRSIQKLLVLPQQTTAALYSKKLGWGILRLQFVAGFNWKLRKCMLDYRWGCPALDREDVIFTPANLTKKCVNVFMSSFRAFCHKM